MLLHSIVFACRCARVQAEFDAASGEGFGADERSEAASASPIIDG
ncbi:MAG: hypothetical protein K0S37_924 [Microbacterium sp.]|jgi:hypothetical protein|nr:hypothetical protein [Microbacterium sp.]